jgi:hypothetical protein
VGYCVGPSCHSPGGGAGCRLCRILQRPGASSRVWVWALLENSPKAIDRLLARVGAGGQPQISEGTRRLPGDVLQGSRSGVGLVPVAVNDYSAQKGGAEVVPGGMETWGGRRSAAYASSVRLHIVDFPASLLP